MKERIVMGQKLSDITDQDIKDIMKAIARANGRPLSDERIDADLPAYKNYLAAIERLTAYNFAVEDEPAFHFALKPKPGNGAKEGSR
jgi:hypothetical protein